jgi:DNA helicase-2/ATP-dependent DNA helicase PcrA
MIDFDPAARTITVTDYKTGKPFSKWDLPPSSGEHMRIKAHRYRQQLLFYKLLVDGSSEWGAQGWRAEHGVLRFVDPDEYGKLRQIGLSYDPQELERTKQLVLAIWQRIMALDFPDVSSTYSPDLAGIMQFETDLLA